MSLSQHSDATDSPGDCADTMPHVLVVDDELRLRELLTDALDGQYRVTCAASGAEAIAAGRLHRPDFIVTDLRLGDCTGLEVIDALRDHDGDTQAGEIPALVITGCSDVQAFSEASRHRPVELMTKPLDIGRLLATIAEEFRRQGRRCRQASRLHRLRQLARQSNQQRKTIHRQLAGACTDLSAAYKTLTRQNGQQKIVIAYQTELVGAHSDDDVFRSLFRLFVTHSGPVYGVALVCDGDAELKIAGRFGVPYPDGLKFCQAVTNPLVDLLLTDPRCHLRDLSETTEQFDPSVRRYLVGVTALALPLMPTDGELIGAVILYRKGEQPFTDDDLSLADAITHPTAIAVRRTD